jgi:hypothetical protein
MSDVGNVHSGEVEGELEGVLRTLIAAAGRMGENIARAREEAARKAEAESTQKARELQAQYEQERALARAQVQPINEPAWWDRARPEDIAHAYETTAAWKDNDPALAQAHAHMRDELHKRYWIDVDDIGADPRRVAQALNERQAASQLIPVQGFPDWERREADQLIKAADHHDRAAESARSDAQRGELPLPLPLTEAERAANEALVETWTAKGRSQGASEPGADAGESVVAVGAEESAASEVRNAGRATWDSAERRDGHAEHMAAQGVDPVAIQAQYGADVSNAKHPRAAVTTTRGAAKARKASPKAMGSQRERDGRSR